MSVVRPIMSARKLMKAIHNKCMEQKAEKGEISASEAASNSEEVVETNTAITSGGSTEDYTDEILENDSANGKWKGTVWYAEIGHSVS